MYRWRAPRVELPPTPLYYVPEVYQRILTDPLALGVTSEDIAAMRLGVLERLPLSYVPLRYEDLLAARAVAAATLQREQAAEESGALPPVEELNPTLTAEDAELLQSDLDVEEVWRNATLRSLSNLQKPIYTEMGQQAAEERHTARLERAVPAELRGFLSAASPTSP
ncbi:hypothetical protein AGDE_04250, partial [Angomonas deanei]